MRHLVIINPRAGRGRKGRSRKALEEAFRRRGLRFELALTGRPGHAGELVAEHGGSFGSIIVVGGDGTLHEVLQTLDLRRHRLGIVPWGTGNDFAWMQGWSPDIGACADRIAGDRIVRVDVGHWASEAAGLSGRFHNSVGFGFEASVNRASHTVRGIRGPLIYVLALIKTLPRFRAYEIGLEWEGGGHDGRAVLIAIANGKRVGGCFLLAPDASQDDGLLDLVRSGPISLLELFRLLPQSFKGHHLRSPSVETVRSPWFQLRAPGGIPMYVDGEFVSEDLVDVTLRIEPGALATYGPTISVDLAPTSP